VLKKFTTEEVVEILRLKMLKFTSDNVEILNNDTVLETSKKVLG
jgi:hypothetical protein